MDNVKLREPYRLSELIKMFADAIITTGIDKSLDDTYFCIFTKEEERASAELICYVDDYPTVTENDEEIFSDFVIKEELEYFCSGEDLEGVVFNLLHQKNQPSMDEFIAGLNYYLEHDSFLIL